MQSISFGFLESYFQLHFSLGEYVPLFDNVGFVQIVEGRVEQMT
jgi:hypothetical protein